VTVSVAEYGSQRVFVTGEVQRPGRYPLKADRSLLALLGDVGALGSNVGHEVIVVRPPVAGAGTDGPAVPLSMTEEPEAAKTPGKADAANDDGLLDDEPAPAPTPPSIPGLPFVAPGSEVFRISLLELQSGNPERNIALQAGDTVYFPKAAQVYVMGSVSRPGPVRFQEGMTVLQALTLAGGSSSGVAGEGQDRPHRRREEGREEGQSDGPRPAGGHAGRAGTVLLGSTQTHPVGESENAIPCHFLSFSLGWSGGG